MKDGDNIGENPLFIQTLTLFRLLLFFQYGDGWEGEEARGSVKRKREGRIQDFNDLLWRISVESLETAGLV